MSRILAVGLALFLILPTAWGREDGDLVIKEIVSLTGGYYRIGAWHPFDVTLRSENGFEGTIVLRGGGGVDISMKLLLQPKREDVHVALVTLATRPPAEIRVEAAKGNGIVLSAPYRGRLESLPEEKMLIGLETGMDEAPIRQALPQELECAFFTISDAIAGCPAEIAFDGVNGLALGREKPAIAPSSLAGWEMRGGKVYSFPLEGNVAPPRKLLAVPTNAMLSAGGGIEKEDPRSGKALLVVLLYLFAAFLMFPYLASRRIGTIVSCAVAVGLAALFVVWALVSIGGDEIFCEISDTLLAKGDVMYDHRVYLFTSVVDRESDVVFDHLVKPLSLDNRGGGFTAVEMEVSDDGRCSVKRMKTIGRKRVGFASYRRTSLPQLRVNVSGDRTVVNSGTIDLHELFLLSSNGLDAVGDLRAGETRALGGSGKRSGVESSFLRSCRSELDPTATWLVGRIEPIREISSGVRLEKAPAATYNGVMFIDRE